MNATFNSHQRVDGEARLRLVRTRDGNTALADLYQRAPCRVLFPAVEADDAMQAVMLTTSGGLTGGDRTAVRIDVGAGANATVTTQAAEKIYRALPLTGDVRVTVDMSVGADAWGEWLAQETILFNGARLRRSFNAEVTDSGRLLAVESVVFGRTAMGESFDSGFLHDSWRIRRGGRLVWADAARLEGDVRQLRTAAFGYGTSLACATLLYVGMDAGSRLEAARRLLGGNPLAGVTVLDGLLIVRLLAADAATLRTAMIPLIAGLRHSIAGLPARLPRVWHC